MLNPLPQLFILIFLESELSLPLSQCLFMSHRPPLARRMKNGMWLFSHSERGTSSSGLVAEEPGAQTHEDMASACTVSKRPTELGFREERARVAFDIFNTVHMAFQWFCVWMLMGVDVCGCTCTCVCTCVEVRGPSSVS